MAAVGNKRPLPPKIAAMRARKRLKLDGKSSSSHGQMPLRQNALKVDSLAWKDVAMPDHLDDYEGFFGLEEVENVQIVKDPETGGVSFASTKSAPKPIQKVTRENLQNAKSGSIQEVDDDDDGDEWSGFDEASEPDEHDVKSITSKVKTSTETQNGSTRTTIQKPNKAPEVNNAPKVSNSNMDASNATFSALGMEDSNATNDVSAWQNLKLLPDTLAALSSLKFSRPTPIQAAAIPEILAGHDVVGKASTGSGKTLAFGIPILETFLEQTHRSSSTNKNNRSPLALILSPTRELAHQLDKHLKALCSNGIFDPPRIATLTGGLAVEKQQRLLRTADIVLGTPGRLWEVVSEGNGISKALREIKFLVVDEADRLLSEGHYKEVEEILNALDREDGVDEAVDLDVELDTTTKSANQKTARQTLIFSATFDRGLQKKLAARNLKSDNNLMNNKDTLQWLLSKLNFRQGTPKFIDVNPLNQLATGLKEGLVECGGSEKDLYLYTLTLLQPNARTLVFANSIDAVRRLTPLLQNLNLSALALHSGMAQKARLRSVERFKEGSASILIATDVAARGLDIPHVDLIIHYHLPRAADTYVHRSGRTARAGSEGSSILICAPEEVGGVRRLVAKVHASRHTDGGAESGGRQGGYFIRTLDIDRKLVTRLKPRVTLAKRIADTNIAKEKRSKEDDFMRAAAEELGVDYDSDEFEAEGGKGRRGRGSGRKKKERDAAGLSKGETGALRAELKDLLKQRVNVGVSERYLTSGRVDVDELLRRQEAGAGHEFLGSVQHGLLD